MAKQITLSIDDAKWPDFKKYFLITHPNQTTGSPSPLSDDEWIFHRILLFARGSYEKGLAFDFAKQNPPPIDNEIINLL